MTLENRVNAVPPVVLQIPHSQVRLTTRKGVTEEDTKKTHHSTPINLTPFPPTL